MKLIFYTIDILQLQGVYSYDMNLETRPEISVSELPVRPSNKEPKEVLQARRQAQTLVDNNELHRKLGLVTDDDIKIFDLSIEERLIRNEIINVSNKIIGVNVTGVFGLINKEIVKRFEKQKERLYKAKEYISLEKEGITKFYTPGGKLHAHNIDLAANGIFRQAQEVHRNMLIPETILDDWIVDGWASLWREKVHEDLN